MGLFRGPGGGLILGPNGGIVRQPAIIVALPRRIDPQSVSFVSTATPGTKIADLVFVGFDAPPPVDLGREFADEFEIEFGGRVYNEFGGYSLSLLDDAGGRVALAGSWNTGYSLVVGIGDLGGTANQTITLAVGGLQETFQISVAIAQESITGTIFTARVENADTVASWSDQEMQAGLAFQKGDVVSGQVVVALVDGIQIPTQLSNRIYWTDGSLKFAQARWLMPQIPAGGFKSIVWHSQTGSWNSQDTARHTATTAITSKVALEYAFTSWRGRSSTNVLTAERGPKVFRSNDMLGSSNAAWIEPIMSGPVCCEWRASDMAAVGTGKDANFGAILYARAWGGTANNPKRIQFLYRTVYGWNTAVTAGEEGIRVNIDLRVNGTTVRGNTLGTAGWGSVDSWLGGFMASAGPTGQMDWFDVETNSFVTPPKLVYRHDVTYGVKSRFFPPFDTDNNAFPMAITPATYQPGKRGPLRPIQDDVGDHEMLCWTTAKPMARMIAAYERGTAAQITLHAQHARAAGWGMGAMTGIGLHRDTRKILSYLPPSKSTNQTVLGSTIYGSGKVASAAAALRPEIQNLDTSHFPQMAYPCYLFEGDQHWLDLAYTEATLPGVFEANAYGFYGTSDRVKIPFGGICWRGQIRGVGHSVRPIVNAMGIGHPSDPHHTMVVDYFNHWAEMTREVPLEEDAWRGGIDRGDGRRFQDLKLLWPNNEPSYKIWMHTFGLHALSYGYGITENAAVKERADWWSHAPVVTSGGYHNDTGPQYDLMKPDPLIGSMYLQICMNGLTDTSENRRYWHFGQWQTGASNCTYKTDGVTVTFADAMPNMPTMQDGMIITVSGVRSASEPHWVSDNTKVPTGLTRGIPYYSVQSSGLSCKLALSPGGQPVTFNTGGADMVGQAARGPIGGIHPMRSASSVSVDANAYIVQVKAALDVYRHYVAPQDARVQLARTKLADLKAGSSAPNAWDDRGKMSVI